MKKGFEKSKILIVDDQPKNLQVLAITLKKQNLKTIAAIDGKQALQIVESNPPDLILLDIMMPRMDGFEVCKKIKANPNTKNIPVIFLTAKDQSEDVIKGFEVGAVDYITKPFNSAEMIQRVFTHLELKKSRDLISHQNNELKNLNKSKDQMFSIIGHDLRGPLGNFQNMLDILIDEKDDISENERDEMMHMLRDTAAQTYYLLENLLNWSRAERGDISHTPEKFILNNVVDEVLAFINANAENKGIKIATNLDKEYEVFADKNMVNTIVRNLVSNAIKFTPTGGSITVTAKNIGDFVKVAVTDTGIGISKDTQKKIFNIKEYYTSFGTNNEKGSGLGLSLCKDFVEKNQGEISLKSEPGKGSTFFFTLPINELKE